MKKMKVHSFFPNLLATCSPESKKNFIKSSKKKIDEYCDVIFLDREVGGTICSSNYLTASCECENERHKNRRKKVSLTNG